jgi:hypothetical protein
MSGFMVLALIKCNILLRMILSLLIIIYVKE